MRNLTDLASPCQVSVCCVYAKIKQDVKRLHTHKLKGETIGGTNYATIQTCREPSCYRDMQCGHNKLEVIINVN